MRRNHYQLNKPHIVKIDRVIKEREDVVSLFFKYFPKGEGIPVEARPGQFFMVWVPGSDEVPMSISRIMGDNYFSISVADVGETTHILNNLKAGDEIGIRGPFGNCFTVSKGNPGEETRPLFVFGGGIGMAAVLPLIKEILSDGAESMQGGSPKREVYIFQGVKTEKEILFKEEISELLENYYGDSDLARRHLIISTDDGSFGFQGFPTDIFAHMVRSGKISGVSADMAADPGNGGHTGDDKANAPIIYGCGPERMLKALLDLSLDFGFVTQLSLERMMRCGFGLCGLCALEPTGLLVCKDGPVFSGEQLKNVTDFGSVHRSFSGKTFKV